MTLESLLDQLARNEADSIEDGGKPVTSEARETLSVVCRVYLGGALTLTAFAREDGGIELLCDTEGREFRHSIHIRPDGSFELAAHGKGCITVSTRAKPLEFEPHPYLSRNTAAAALPSSALLPQVVTDSTNLRQI